ncbi:3'(2'),5'-bisphosphate nucleotidase [Thermodesulfobacteriota bacterium]
MSFEKEQEMAKKAVLSASVLCEQIRRDLAPEALEKDDGTPVTVADFVSQALICKIISETFPSASIIAEEDASTLRKPANRSLLIQVTGYLKRVIQGVTPEQVLSWIGRGQGEVKDRFWVLDPVDGTKGFLRGGQYAVALALIEGKTVKLGCLGCPELPLKMAAIHQKKGMLFSAVRGEGSCMRAFGDTREDPLEVYQKDQLSDLISVESFEASHSDQSGQEAVARSLGLKLPPVRMDSQAKYGVVARGEAVLYLRLPSPESADYREKIWDHAAGSLIVEEAGGRVTDTAGYPLDFSQVPEMRKNRGLVVSNGKIHDKVLAAL